MEVSMTELSDHQTVPFTHAMYLPGATTPSLGLGLNLGDSMTASINTTMTEPTSIMSFNSNKPIPLGSLHERRAKASPAKFNTGSFEPRPLRTDQAQLLSIKRLRAADGTPRSAQSPGSQLAAGLNGLGIRTPLLRDSQLTARLSRLGHTTPIAYAIPLSAIPPTPRTAQPKRFDLLVAFCKHNDLMLLLTSYLNIPSLITLYAIHKPFHHVFNCHHTAYILSIMRTWAPKADKIFPWRNYQKLCIKDPRQRQKSRLEGKEKDVRYQHEDLRDVPSIRWLQMVVWREGICRDIIMQLAIKGQRCPGNTVDALKVNSPHHHAPTNPRN
jgi:hypothetical protein